MTPEQRAAVVVREYAAHIRQAVAQPAALHSLVALAIHGALGETRSVCTYVPDKDRISNIMLWRPL